ncbi:MAG TPA: ABC transporter permease [Candidatus Acidoferrales bacterium]|nr:ABC transporter permease [Candidatus Acidoferrales bacterium]
MRNLEQNFKFAARQLRRNPGFTATVMITLALAIGANTAIFSLLNALIFETLPYPHPDRIGTIYARITGGHPSDQQIGIDGARWELLRDNVPGLISAVAGGTSGVNLRAGSHIDYVHDGRISARYLDVLGVQPLIGRNFSQQEDRPGGPPAAILSFNLWRAVFGGDAGILGKSIDLKGQPYMVIGVLPQGATTPLNADLYTSLQPSRQGEGGGTNFDVITRLRDGGSWQEADAQINRAWAALARNFEKRSEGSRITYYSVPLQKAETDSLRPQVIGLMLAAGLILLIACANLAALTLVRVLRRTPEVATRLALGASPWQIQKQFWSENLLLAIMGGAVGIGVGFIALRGLLLLLPPHFLPVEQVSLDARVLAFTVALSLLTSILFGMLPALAVRNTDLRSSMGGRSIAGGSVRLRQLLIAAEIAVTVVLLAASGLLIRTLVHLETLPKGFIPNGVMIAKASLDDARYHDPAAFRKLLDESTAAMRRIPGVVDAAVGLTVPYETVLNDGVTLSDGKDTGQTVGTDVIYATPSYFHTLQMPLLAGRAFTDADGPNSQHVAIVNQTFARKFYGGANPVGHYLDKNTLIVGEVSDVPISSRLDPVAPLQGEETMYVPAAQVDGSGLALIHTWFQPDWIVRTAGPVQGLTAQIQGALSSADPDLPASGFYSMGDLLARTLATQRIEVALLGVMAGLALLLSAVGIFALVANIVTQRTREIGIRMALGSTIAQAMLQVGRAGIIAAVVGLAVGLAASAGVLQLMRGLLYGVGVYDGPTLVGVVLVLSGVALAATALPTLHIAGIDPARTLREE